MNGLDAHYDSLLAEHQLRLDWQAEQERAMDKLTAQIAELLEDHSFHELSRLTGVDDTLCMKIVHGLYSKDPNDWEAERVGNIWAIYGKTFSGEWIDANGDCLAFDTKEEAEQYIKEEIK